MYVTHRGLFLLLSLNFRIWDLISLSSLLISWGGILCNIESLWWRPKRNGPEKQLTNLGSREQLSNHSLKLTPLPSFHFYLMIFFFPSTNFTIFRLVTQTILFDVCYHLSKISPNLLILHSLLNLFLLYL